jgi:ATP phosphoribosyltransferase
LINERGAWFEVLTEESSEMTTITLGLPKGRFLPNSLRVLQSMSAEIADHARRLAWLVRIRDVSLTVKLLKPPDIANLLATGEVDFGVLPDEWIREHHAAPVEMLDLGWCTSRIVLAGDPRHFDRACRDRLRIATSYPNFAAECLRPLVDDLVIRHVHGSAEAFVPDLCDCVFDCVETGATLQENGLTVLRTFLQSSVRLFAASAAVASRYSKHILMHFHECA